MCYELEFISTVLKDVDIHLRWNDTSVNKRTKFGKSPRIAFTSMGNERGRDIRISSRPVWKAKPGPLLGVFLESRDNVNGICAEHFTGSLFVTLQRLALDHRELCMLKN